MEKKAKLIIGNIYTILKDPQEIVIGHFKNYMKYQNDFFLRKQTNFAMPEFTYLINKDGMFLTGLLNIAIKVLNNLMENGDIEDFELVDNRTVTKHPDPEKALEYFFKLPVNPRDYQIEAFVKGLKRCRGIFDLPTSAGKTVILGGLIGAWTLQAGFKSVIILKSTTLCEQIIEELSELLKLNKDDIGFIGAGNFRERKITVATVQTLNSFIKKQGKEKDNVVKFLKSIKAVFIDEVHNATSDSYKRVLTNCSEASVCFGFSATPLSSKVKAGSGGKTDRDILLHAYVGPKIYKITTKELAMQGYLSIPEIIIVDNKIDSDSIYLDFDEEYERFIVKSKARNKLICDIVYHHYMNEESVIGFVVSINHGKKLAKMLIEDYNVPPEHLKFVHGTSTDRTEIIDDFKKGRLPIMFGTILNEGLNFMPNVGINISGNESEKYAKQRLGRVLRKPKDKKTGEVDVNKENKVTYYDFKDSGHYMFLRHSSERISVYENEGHFVLEVEEDKIDQFLKNRRKEKPEETK